MKLSKTEVGRGAGFLFIESIVGLFAGYVFWFIMTKFTTSDVIGIAAAVISLANIFVVISILGVPSGVQRFLGKSFAEKKLENAKVQVKASMILITIGIVANSLLIILVNNLIGDFINFEFNLLIVAIILVASMSTFRVVRNIVIASLQTKWLPLVMIVSTTGKIILAIILLLMGTGAIGVTIGFTFSGFVGSILLSFYLLVIFKGTSKHSEVTLYRSMKDILIAGSANWIPALVTRIGTQLGTIVVFGLQGATQAGVYFIAFSVATAIMTVMLVLLTIAFPTLSGMTDGRKRFAWRMTKMSLILGIPFSISVIFYAKDVLLLFGPNYIDGVLVLQLLLVSMLPITVATGIRTLVYSYGNYRQVLTIGLFTGIPRIILYFVLVTFYGNVGAASAFTIGAVIGYIASVFIANRVGLKIFWKDQALIVSVPALFSFVLSYFEIPSALGIPAILIISYLVFLKIGLISKSDLKDSSEVLPKKIGVPVYRVLNNIAEKIKSSY